MTAGQTGSPEEGTAPPARHNRQSPASLQPVTQRRLPAHVRTGMMTRPVTKPVGEECKLDDHYPANAASHPSFFLAGARYRQRLLTVRGGRAIIVPVPVRQGQPGNDGDRGVRQLVPTATI